jgi:hypothetical protein
MSPFIVIGVGLITIIVGACVIYLIVKMCSFACNRDDVPDPPESL